MVSFTDHYNAILLTDSLQKLKLEKVRGDLIILFYVSTSSSPLKNILQFQNRVCFCLLKTQKATTLQQVAGRKIPNLVLKRMLELFLKIPPLKKILEFQD